MRRFVPAGFKILATVTALVAASLAVGPTSAAERAPHAPAALEVAQLEAAQRAGRPIIVHVTAPWCATCAAQIPIVIDLLKSPKYKDLVLFNVDFATQKAVLRELDVRAQSTFVAFKGQHEVGRSTGVTDRDAIAALFDRTR